jgi:hypothetical protein
MKHCSPSASRSSGAGRSWNRIAAPLGDSRQAARQRFGGKVGATVRCPHSYPVDLVYGPLWHWLLHGHAPLTDRFVQDVITATLNGIQPLAGPAPATAS